MKKVLSIFATATFAFAFAFTASASTIPWDFDALFDGYQEVTGNPREVVELSVRVEADSAEVVHAIGTRINDGTAEVCHDIKNFEGEQDKTETVDIKLPATTGDYDLEVFVYTAPSMQAANALKGDVACAGSEDTSASYNDVIHVVPGSSNGGTGTGSTEDDAPAWLQAILNSLTQAIAGLSQKVDDLETPKGPECPPAYYGGNRIQVQAWLMNNGYAQGFNNVGIFNTTQLSSPSVIWGSVSSSAYAQALAACGK